MIWEPFLIFNFVDEGKLKATNDNTDITNIVTSNLFVLKRDLAFMIWRDSSELKN
jgi:hypothetical protein